MIQGTIVYKGGSLGKRVAGLRPEVKQALIDAVKLWHSDFLKFHFGTLGAVQSRYPGVYVSRTPQYMRDKAKKYGHQDTLVWSGRTKQLMLQSISVSGTSKRARGRLQGSNTLNFGGIGSRHDGNPRPDMRSEATAINQSEAEALRDFIQARVAAFLNSNEGQSETVSF